MILFGKNLDTEIAVIAEVGVNHEGSLDKAMELLELASDAGADAVKLQTYTPERFISAADPVRFERVTRFGLSVDDLKQLADKANQIGITLFSTPVTEDVIPMLDTLFPVFKIASGDLTFEPTIRAVARTGKPAILSTGIGNMQEIETAIDWFRDEAGVDDLRDRLILMHCVSAYPTPIEQANVMSVPFLAEKTGLRVGYSNHVIGPEASIAAAAHGASVIEVHFTDCKTGRDFRDHELSFEPDDLKHLVEILPAVNAAVGIYKKEPMACEIANRTATRKGMVCAGSIEAGTVLTRADIMFARPEGEYAVSELDKLVGMKTLVPLAKGQPFQRDQIK